jgi:seryl-tRNA synthetase
VSGYLCAKLKKMLQVQVLRQNPDWVKERLAVKHFANTEIVDEVISLDDERKKLQLEADTLQSKINSSSKEIGMLMGKGQKEEAESKKIEVATIKASLQPLADKQADTEKQLNDIVAQPAFRKSTGRQNTG